MNKISRRLEAIASLVEDNKKIIDIGCDHALLDIYLIKNKKNLNIIASDINNNALNNAKDNIKKYRVDIDIRLGNGLDVVNKDEIHTIITSGIGAHTIVGILYNNIDKLENVDTIIIQSNNDLHFIRQKVVKLNYYIEDEILVLDKNIIYTIIKFKKGIRKYNKKQLLLGPVLLNKKGDLFKKKCLLEKQKIELVLKLVPKNKLLYRYKLKKKIKMYEGI